MNDEPTTPVELTDWDLEMYLYAIDHIDWADDPDINAHTESMRDKIHDARARLRGDA
jgi:hypothetical protein